MAVGFSNTNKPLNPRGNDASPKGYNRAALYSGKALDFDGVNDKVTSSAFSLDTSSFSISMILKSDSVVSDEIFFAFAETGANNESFIFYKDSTNSNKIAFYGAPFTGSPVLLNYVIPTDYEHLTFTFASNTLSLYVNGVFVDSGSVTGNDGTQTASAMIGVRKLASYSQYFNGQITNTKIFNEVLTAAQVADLYNNPEKVVPTGVDNTALKLWLPMQEGAGTTAYDGSGNGNHGTISGATYVNGVGAPVAQTAVIDWNKGSNLLAYSEQFDNVYWTTQLATITANDTTAPDGQNTAEKITPTGSTFSHYLYSPTSFNNQNTISVFAKYNGYNIGIRASAIGNGQAFANFDLQNGTILGSGGAVYEDSSITSFSDGWYRISMTMNNVSTYGINFYAVNGTTATELPNFTADGTSGFYLWGAQVNDGATLTPYTPTIATAQTSPVLLPQGLTSGRDITGVNLFENVRKQGALNLDGNSWAEVHDNESLDFGSGSWTFELWLYWDGLASGDGIMSRWYSTERGPLFYVTGGQVLRLYTGRTSGSSDAYTDANTSLTNGWHHIVGTYDSSDTKLRIYLDGALDKTSAAISSAYASNAQPLEIGRLNNDANGTYTNSIAQPRIYNRALTAAEVLQNYNSGKNTYK